MRWYTLLFLPLILFTVYAPVKAATRPSIQALQAAFKDADKNHDGKIDREEFQRRSTEIFFFTDVDKDGKLTSIELKGVEPEAFKNADRDGDGMLSLYEFINIRFQDFESADLDKDGTLSPAEVEQR